MTNEKDPKNNNDEQIDDNEESVDYLLKRANKFLNAEPGNIKYPGRKKTKIKKIDK